MNARLKRLIERLLPHGTDLFKDVAKVVSPTTFKTVLDVGSHRGQSILEYLNAFPQAQIHGFEPSEGLFLALDGKFRSEHRVQLHQTAVSDSNGEAVFYL